jgi:hypothetical protein
MMKMSPNIAAVVILHSICHSRGSFSGALCLHLCHKSATRFHLVRAGQDHRVVWGSTPVRKLAVLIGAFELG